MRAMDSRGKARPSITRENFSTRTMRTEGIRNLGASESTQRHWNFRDDIHGHYFGTIPFDQPNVTLELTWKATAGDQPRLVGRFRVNLPVLERDGLVRRSDRGWILRFQRTGSRIEVAISRGSKALVVGPVPRSTSA